MGEFRMPAMGADMEAGTLVEWRIAPGGRVNRGDVIAVVETDKGAIEVEIFQTGVLEQVLVTPGTRVPVGTLLAVIAGEGAATPAPTAAPAAATTVAPPPIVIAPPATVVAPSAPLHEVAAPPGVNGHVRVSPLARRHAATLGVDLARVHGTGIGGAVTVEDVERAAAEPAPSVAAAPPSAPPSAPPAARLRVSPLARRRAAELGVDLARVAATGADGAITLEDVERAAAAPPAAAPPPAAPAAARPPAAQVAERQAAMRRAIAAAMARSKREIPHYYLQADVDMHRALTWLEAENAKRPLTTRLLPAVLLLKAVAFALHEVPEMNGFYLEGGFQPSPSIHIGVAISLRQGGLVAPAVHDADQLTLDELMAALRDLVARTRAGGLRSSEMTDATITVSNLGDQGVSTVFGVIYPPQVALVGFGTVAERPWAVDGLLGVRPILSATLSGDHRASDGHRGGRFLAAIDRLLQEPERLQGPWQPPQRPAR